MFRNKIIKKITSLVLSAVFVASAFSGCVSSSAELCTVNGVKVEQDVVRYLTNTQKISVSLNLLQQGISATDDMTDEYLKQSTGDKTFAEQLNQQIINQAVYFELLNQLFEKEGLKIDEAKQKEIDEKFQSDVDEVYHGDKYFDEYLKLTKGTRDIYKKFIEADFKEQMLFEHYYGKGGTNEISDEEFEKNTGLIQHVLYKTTIGNTTEEVSDEVKEEKEAGAKKALADLKSGKTTIEKLMQTVSEDPGAASYPEGYFVFTGQGQMYPAFEEGSLAVKYNDYAIVESPVGYHVVKHNPLPFADKEKMANYIRQYKSNDFSKIVEEFKTKCDIKYNDKVIKKYDIAKFKATSVTDIQEFFQKMNKETEKKATPEASSDTTGDAASDEK